MRRIALLLLLVAPVGADLETALFFVKKAREAIDLEDYDKAEHWCRRALEEEKDFAPALLALAELAHAQGDRTRAMRYLDSCIAQDSERLSDAERQAVRQARRKMKELDAARFEFRRLVDGHVRKVLALARREAKKNPKLARECWRNVLLVDPDNEEATRRLGPADELPAEGVLLFNGKDMDGWGGKEPEWTLRDGHLCGRIDDAANIMRHKEEVRGDYSLIYELRVEEDLGKEPLVGIIFGLQSEHDYFVLQIWTDSWWLAHRTGEKKHSELARRLFKLHKAKYNRSDWNTYRIDVKGKRITGFVNGKKIWSTSGAIRSLDGFVGLLVQDQAVEIRKIQLIER